MLNQVILVGRLVRTPELQLTESGKKKSLITLAVSRGFKNQNGEYDTDFLDCTLWSSIAENTSEYCKTGDVIGVKGRLQTRLIDNEEGTKYKKVEVIADKVTFLSSSRNENNNCEKFEDADDYENSSCEEVNNDVETIEKKSSKKKK